MGRLNTRTVANGELQREVDAVRTMAAEWQRQEERGLIPSGTADAFRRDMAMRIRLARVAAIRNSESFLESERKA
jgi:hypothetical protein